MYSNKILIFLRVCDNSKCLYKKVWKLIEGTTMMLNKETRNLFNNNNNNNDNNADCGMKPKESETKERYLHLAREQRKL